VTEVRYAFIDALPDALLDPVVANPHGKLRPRAEAITVMRLALLDGRLPAELGWPEPAMRAAILDGLAQSGVVAHCAANPAITDEVLAGILGATHKAQTHCDELVAEWTLASRERDKQIRIVGVIPGPGHGESLVDEATWQRIRADAAVIAGRVALEALTPLLDDWTLRASDRVRFQQLLVELAAACGATPNRVAGVLRSIDWRTSAELRRMMAGVPALGHLLRLLGRDRASDDPTNARALETRGERVVREVTVEQQTVQELQRIEIRGVERSGEVARMLASEAVLRCLPATRRLWHARHAERALMTYHADSVYTERSVLEQCFRDGVV